jgi:hypothetical protein
MGLTGSATRFSWQKNRWQMAMTQRTLIQRLSDNATLTPLLVNVRWTDLPLSDALQTARISMSIQLT